MIKLLKSRKCSDDSIEFEFCVSNMFDIITSIYNAEDIHIGTINATMITNKKIKIYNKTSCMELLRAGLLSDIEYTGAFRQNRIILKLDVLQDKIVVSLQKADDLLELTKLLEVYYD